MTSTNRNNGDFEKVNTVSQTTENSCVVRSESQIKTYEASVAGITRAVNDAPRRSAILLPAGIYDLGTRTLSPPKQCQIRGVRRRGTQLLWSEGVGTAIDADDGLSFAEVSLLGPNTGTNTDKGIDATGGPFQRYYSLEVSGFAQLVDWNGAFNSSAVSSNFSNQTGDATGFRRTGAFVFDADAGSHDDSRLLGCYFGANQNEAITIDTNAVTVANCDFESNGANADYVVEVLFGNKTVLNGLMFSNPESATSVMLLDPGSTGLITAIEASSVASSPNSLINGKGDDWNVADPIHAPGFNIAAGNLVNETADRWVL